MFTVRFMKRDSKGHQSYSCAEYETTHIDGAIEVRMVLKDGADIDEMVGPDSPFDIAYVTNEAGRTIDKIKL